MHRHLRKIFFELSNQLLYFFFSYFYYKTVCSFNVLRSHKQITKKLTLILLFHWDEYFDVVYAVTKVVSSLIKNLFFFLNSLVTSIPTFLIEWYWWCLCILFLLNNKVRWPTVILALSHLLHRHSRFCF
jgi:hypothetical protein